MHLEGPRESGNELSAASCKYPEVTRSGSEASVQIMMEIMLKVVKEGLEKLFFILYTGNLYFKSILVYIKGKSFCLVNFLGQ